MGFKTDYKDDIINTTSNEKRQYEMIQNGNGTVSFNDVTVYEQVGDTLGAKELNEISEKLNISGERIRYNNVTDMVQILNDDGVWEDWSSGSTAIALLKNGIITTTYYSDSLEISTEYSGFSYFYPTSESNYVVFNNSLKSYFGKYIKIVAKSDTSGATVKVSEKFQTSITGGTIDIVTLSLEEYEKSFYVPVQYIENCNVAELELQFGLGIGVYIKTIEITASDGTEGGGGSDDVDLTQAEYDALPDTKLTDNKNYFIKDATENNGNLVRNGKSYTGGGVNIESEVIDIRLKADGTKATSAGNAVREQVAELKSDLIKKYVPYSFGKNLFNHNDSSAYLNSGKYVNYTNGHITDNENYRNAIIYDLEVGKNIVISEKWVHITFFNRKITTEDIINKNDIKPYFISGALQQGTITPVTVPNGTVTLIVSGGIPDNFQVEYGNEQTEFEPYREKGINGSEILERTVSQSALNFSIPMMDFSMFDQVFIKNHELTCNNDNLNSVNTLAKYIQVDMGSNVVKVMARVKWKDSGTVALISTNLDNNTYVNNITLGSIHITFTPSGADVCIFNDNQLKALGHPKYTITPNTEYEIGYSVSENTITVYLPNGEQKTYIDSDVSVRNGKYVIYEHYVENVTPTETPTDLFNHTVFTGFYCSCESGFSLKDNFKRNNGSIGVAPSGHNYTLFRATTSSDTMYDGSGKYM